MKDKIKKMAQEHAEEFIAIRRHLHAYPELSYKEYKTSQFIQDKLTRWNISFEIMAETGVVALIKGKNPEKRVVALRADIDALPILEKTEKSYASKSSGIMHACGHDVHTTCLLGAIFILKELKNEWEGTIKCIFQPGEERNPGGASLLIKEGVLKNPKPQSIFGLHVNPQLEIGKLSFRAGKVMASADEVFISVKSKGGHAAAAHLTVDTVSVSAFVINSLQQIISRNCPPLEPSVLSITSIHGGSTTNVIPSEVKMMGSFRAMNEEWRLKAHELITHQVQKLGEAFGCQVDIIIDKGYPMVFNNPILHNRAIAIAHDFLAENLVEETELRMGAEDFGFYSQQIPGCFFRLGIKNESKGITAPVHTPEFDIDESAIEIGIGIMAYLGTTADLEEII